MTQRTKDAAEQFGICLEGGHILTPHEKRMHEHACAIHQHTEIMQKRIVVSTLAVDDKATIYLKGLNTGLNYTSLPH